MSNLSRTFKIWHFISHYCDICSCDMFGKEDDCEYCNGREAALEECRKIDEEYIKINSIGSTTKE